MEKVEANKDRDIMEEEREERTDQAQESKEPEQDK